MGESRQATMRDRWILAPSTEPDLSERLARRLGVPGAIAALLCARGYGDPEAVERFLTPRLRDLSDPFEIPGVEHAADRIFEAIDRAEPIVLYGDYDVDGITSIALLCATLRALGADPSTFLPLRLDEGYGLTPGSVRRCLRTLRPRLLVAVDCGTSAAEEIRILRQSGVDVIVVDHHEPRGAIPDCCAVVNPKLGGPLRYLCSVGLAFKLAHGLLKKRRLPSFELGDCLDLVALGTIADLVPLTGENRILARRGLDRLPATRSVGLRALLRVAAIEPPLSAAHVGFRLGPRLNAAGRLGEAEDALRLLLTEDPVEADAIAARLDRRNRERQSIEQRTVEEAERAVGSPADLPPAIVVAGQGWHPGVIGIVASRLCRQHHRPVIVVGFDENGDGRGSGRSVAGFSLIEALGLCAPHLARFGGHELAAGVSLRREEFEPFRERFLEHARERIRPPMLETHLDLDAEITLRELTHDLLRAHEAMQPFGVGNPQPMFLARGVVPVGDFTVLGERHLRLRISQRGTERQAIYFNATPDGLARPPWDVAFQIEQNVFRGNSSLQIQVRGIRPAERSQGKVRSSG